MCNIFRTGRPSNFKLGTHTEHKDPHHWQAPWPQRSRSRNAYDSYWSISRERNDLDTPILVGRLPIPRSFSAILIAEAFQKSNSTHPSSAAVERLFSAAISNNDKPQMQNGWRNTWSSVVLVIKTVSWHCTCCCWWLLRLSNIYRPVSYTHLTLPTIYSV